VQKNATEKVEVGEIETAESKNTTEESNSTTTEEKPKSEEAKN